MKEYCNVRIEIICENVKNVTIKMSRNRSKLRYKNNQ